MAAMLLWEYFSKNTKKIESPKPSLENDIDELFEDMFGGFY
jgi:hypothetical protein